MLSLRISYSSLESTEGYFLIDPGDNTNEVNWFNEGGGGKRELGEVGEGRRVKQDAACRWELALYMMALKYTSI